jgi:PKD domain
MIPSRGGVRRRMPSGARLVSALTVVSALSATAAFGSGHRAQAGSIRLEGSFAMSGTLTAVDNVYGEHRGEHVRRTWSFLPRCATGPCDRVTLRRRRSGRHILDVVGLARRGPSLYVGSGRFWIALTCAGAIVRHGGLATETITVRITGTATVGTTRVATRLRATYTNPKRTNLTRCPGGIGHDAASYHGRRITPLPGPPTPSFTDTVDPLTSSATFADQSRPGAGARIISWSWNFGERASPEDTSSQRNPSHRFRSPGVYAVTLTIRDQYGQAATATRQVTV